MIQYQIHHGPNPYIMPVKKMKVITIWNDNFQGNKVPYKIQIKVTISIPGINPKKYLLIINNVVNKADKVK